MSKTQRTHVRPLVVLAVAVTLVATACSSSGSETAASTAPTTTSADQVETTEPPTTAPTTTAADQVETTEPLTTDAASDSSGAGPQTPACGIVEVTTTELIAGVEFPPGQYQINTFGMSCEDVMGDDGLFNEFLQLEDTDELPEPWSHLDEAVGAPKFVTGPGVGLRAERLAD